MKPIVGVCALSVNDQMANTFSSADHATAVCSGEVLYIETSGPQVI